jgi:hypothetical protein
MWSLFLLACFSLSPLFQIGWHSLWQIACVAAYFSSTSKCCKVLQNPAAMQLTPCQLNPSVSKRLHEHVHALRMAQH